MAIAYVSTWVIYIVLHILLSSLLRYDSLIPPGGCTGNIA
jgi:hypothetical protein